MVGILYSVPLLSESLIEGGKKSEYRSDASTRIFVNEYLHRLELVTSMKMI